MQKIVKWSVFQNLRCNENAISEYCLFEAQRSHIIFYTYEKAQRNKVEAVNMPSTYTDKFIYWHSNIILVELQQLRPIALHHNAFLQT